MTEEDEEDEEEEQQKMLIRLHTAYKAAIWGPHTQNARNMADYYLWRKRKRKREEIVL